MAEQSNGQILPKSTVHVLSISKDFLVSKDGRFRAILPAANYELLVKCLGYESKTIAINVPTNTIRNLTVRLTPLTIGKVTSKLNNRPIVGAHVQILETNNDFQTGKLMDSCASEQFFKKKTSNEVTKLSRLYFFV